MSTCDLDRQVANAFAAGINLGYQRRIDRGAFYGVIEAAQSDPQPDIDLREQLRLGFTALADRSRGLATRHRTIALRSAFEFADPHDIMAVSPDEREFLLEMAATSETAAAGYDQLAGMLQPDTPVNLQ